MEWKPSWVLFGTSVLKELCHYDCCKWGDACQAAQVTPQLNKCSCVFPKFLWENNPFISLVGKKKVLTANPLNKESFGGKFLVRSQFLSSLSPWVPCDLDSTTTIPRGSVGTACDAAHVGSTPGSGRFPGGGNDSPLQYSCLDNSMGRGAWWATVHGVTESWTPISN